MNQKKDTSAHILNTSSNLLGICFIVLTSLKLLKMQSDTLVDEFTTGAMILFMTSCILSFLSIKSKRSSERYESIAEISFLSGLICLFITTMFVTFNIMK